MRITLTVFILSLTTCFFAQEVENSVEVEIPWTVNEFSVSDDERIWMIANNGMIYYSNDIDSNWHYDKRIKTHEQSSSMRSFYSRISFFNSDTAILTGYIHFPLPAGNIPYIDERSNLNGLYFTRNKCNTWELIDFKGNTGILTVFLKKNGNAWIGGRSGKIFHSRDFGQNWELLNSPFDFKTQLYCLYMSSDHEGVAGSAKNTIYKTQDNWTSFEKVLTPIDQKINISEPYEHSEEIRKVILWDDYIVVKQNGQVFYSHVNTIDWKSFPFKIVDFEIDKESKKLFCISEALEIFLFTSPMEFKLISAKTLKNLTVDMKVMNHSLFVRCKQNEVYKINEKSFSCRTPFKYNCFCEDTSRYYITKQNAIRHAKKHGLYPSLFASERFGWNKARAELDTAKRVWEIGTDKLSYRSWGKTTKLSQSDYCQRCRFINGCHVIRTRTLWIDAITGKVLKKEKKKRVNGNYE